MQQQHNVDLINHTHQSTYTFDMQVHKMYVNPTAVVVVQIIDKQEREGQ